MCKQLKSSGSSKRMSQTAALVLKTHSNHLLRFFKSYRSHFHYSKGLIYMIKEYWWITHLHLVWFALILQNKLKTKEDQTACKSPAVQKGSNFMTVLMKPLRQQRKKMQPEVPIVNCCFFCYLNSFCTAQFLFWLPPDLQRLRPKFSGRLCTC